LCPLLEHRHLLDLRFLVVGEWRVVLGLLELLLLRRVRGRVVRLVGLRKRAVEALLHLVHRFLVVLARGLLLSL